MGGALFGPGPYGLHRAPLTVERKPRGLESNGMIVAASVGEDGKVLAGFLEDVPIGAKLE
ncbi:MAG TPA: hypothetical protein VIB39_05070 [Candidatus Angelobacter sp.]